MHLLKGTCKYVSANYFLNLDTLLNSSKSCIPKKSKKKHYLIHARHMVVKVCNWPGRLNYLFPADVNKKNQYFNQRQNNMHNFINIQHEKKKKGMTSMDTLVTQKVTNIKYF